MVAPTRFEHDHTLLYCVCTCRQELLSDDESVGERVNGGNVELTRQSVTTLCTHSDEVQLATVISGVGEYEGSAVVGEFPL